MNKLNSLYKARLKQVSLLMVIERMIFINASNANSTYLIAKMTNEEKRATNVAYKKYDEFTNMLIDWKYWTKNLVDWINILPIDLEQR